MAKMGERGWRPTEVHPLAALFPELEPDDLESLAEHIKEHGLQNPIMIDDAGVLIDGRMRLAACEKAGVEPRYERLNGNDPVAYIWGANGKRRQMSKGQMAMIAAESFVANRYGDHTRAAKLAGVSRARFEYALTVKEFAPHQVNEVIAGTVKLDEAYEAAQDNKREKERRDDAIRLLREQDPDLAQRVLDEELDLDEARDELDERKRAAETERNSTFSNLSTLIRHGTDLGASSGLQRLPEWLKTDEGQELLRRYIRGGIDELRQGLEAARAGLDAAIEICRGI